MRCRSKNFRSPHKRIATAGAEVKARIVGAGLKLSDLAAAAGISPSSLSNYLAGSVSRPETRVRIWRAFRRLTGQRISLRRFWGHLMEEAA